MLKKNIIDLLNQELDGTNTRRGSATVKRLLQKNAEARQYFSDLQSVAAMIKQVPTVEPPAHLKKKIFAALHFPEPQGTTPARKRLFDGFFSGLSFRTAYTFAGGAVAGILLFVLFTNIPPDSDSMAGTMAPNHAAAVASANADVNLDQIRGTIAATQTGSKMTADLNLDCRQEIDVVLNYNEHELKVESFHPEDNSRSIITLLEGQARLTLTGPNRCSVSFQNTSDSTPSLTVNLFSRGVLLSSYDLALKQITNH